MQRYPILKNNRYIFATSSQRLIRFQTPTRRLYVWENIRDVRTIVQIIFDAIDTTSKIIRDLQMLVDALPNELYRAEWNNIYSSSFKPA